MNASQLSTYDQVKHMLLNAGMASDGTPLHFCCAFIAGITMTIASAPFDLVKTRVLADSAEGDAR